MKYKVISKHRFEPNKQAIRENLDSYLFDTDEVLAIYEYMEMNNYSCIQDGELIYNIIRTPFYEKP